MIKDDASQLKEKVRVDFNDEVHKHDGDEKMKPIKEPIGPGFRFALSLCTMAGIIILLGISMVWAADLFAPLSAFFAAIWSVVTTVLVFFFLPWVFYDAYKEGLLS